MSSLDNEGEIIVSIITLLQYNIGCNNIILQKRGITSRFRSQKGPFKGIKGLFSKGNIAAV